MKLFLAYLFKGDLYNRYTALQRKIVARKNRLVYAKNYMERWADFNPHDTMDLLFDMMRLKPGKKSYKIVMKIYSARDIAGLDKLLPL